MSRVHGWTAAVGTALALSLTAGTATAAQAVTEAPPLAVGRAARGGVAFRLEGDRLTVTLRRRLAPRGSSARPSIKLICGMAVPGAADDAVPALAYTAFAVSARRDLRVAAGVRTIRARLGADVARWATLCGIRWHSRAGSATVLAAMTLRRGTPPGCAAPPGAEIAAESERALVLEVGLSGDGDGSARYPACSKPDGAWSVLDTSSWSKYQYGRYVTFSAAGSWIGWRVEDVSTGGGTTTCSVRRLDIAADTQIEELAVTPAGYCAWSPAIGPNGLLAWVAKDKGANPRVALVQAVAPGGAIVTLATADPPPPPTVPVTGEQFTDVAVSADGRTVTWRDRGVLRSATF